MPGVGAGLAVIWILAFQSGQTTAAIWREQFVTPVILPKNPNDPYYKAFQTVPPAKVTAKNLMTNFLHVSPKISGRRRRTPVNEDIVAVVDGSGSIGSCEFDKGKRALKYLMDDAMDSKAGKYNTKYAAVTFASSAYVNFKFLPYTTAAQKILNIHYPGGATNTQAGLEKARKLFNDPSSGRRPAPVFKRVLLVTDGQSNIGRHLTETKADALKKDGVLIFVVAVGRSINGIDEMVKVAGGYSLFGTRLDPKLFLFRVESYTAFMKVVKLIVKEVSPGKYTIIKGQYTTPCRYG